MCPEIPPPVDWRKPFAGKQYLPPPEARQCAVLPGTVRMFKYGIEDTFRRNPRSNDNLYPLTDCQEAIVGIGHRVLEPSHKPQNLEGFPRNQDAIPIEGFARPRHNRIRRNGDQFEISLAGCLQLLRRPP